MKFLDSIEESLADVWSCLDDIKDEPGFKLSDRSKNGYFVETRRMDLEGQYHYLIKAGKPEKKPEYECIRTDFREAIIRHYDLLDFLNEEN